MMGPVAAGKQVIQIFQQVKAVADKMEAEFAQSEQTAAILNSTLKATGNAAGLTAEDIQDLAAEFQATTKFEGDMVIGMENVLLGFKNIKGDNFKEASLQILNMATVMNMDLTSAAQAVGKALDDPIRGIDSLSRQGFKFSDDQKAVLKALVETGQTAEAQKIILDELATTYGGAAEAAGDTASAIKVKLSNAIGDINEEIGRSISNSLKPWREKWLQMATAIGAAAKAQNDFRDAVERKEEGKSTAQDELLIEQNKLEVLKDAKKYAPDIKVVEKEIAAQEELIQRLQDKEETRKRGLTQAQRAAEEAARLAKIESDRIARNEEAVRLYNEALKVIKATEKEEEARFNTMGELVDYQELSNTAYEQARKLITDSNGLISEANPMYQTLVRMAQDWAIAAGEVYVAYTPVNPALVETAITLEEIRANWDDIGKAEADALGDAIVMDAIMKEWADDANGVEFFVRKIAVAFSDSKDEAEGLNSTMMDMYSGIADAYGAYVDLQENGSDAIIAGLERQRDQMKENGEDTTAIDKDINAKKNAAAEKQFNAGKATSLANIAINTAEGFMKAFTVDPTGILASIVLGAGIVQGGTVAAQQYVPFASGGYVDQPTHALIGEAGGEWILNKAQMSGLVKSGIGGGGVTVVQNIGGSVWTSKGLESLAVSAVAKAGRGF